MVLFLLNDCVLELQPRTLATPEVAASLSHLSLTDAIAVAKEAFAAEPDLQRKSPVRAQKAALMLMLKQPEINAALFVAQARHCRAQDVATRFASVAAETLYELKGLQDRGTLTSALVNVLVWSRAPAAAA
jgi:hypothetical protein